MLRLSVQSPALLQSALVNFHAALTAADAQSSLDAGAVITDLHALFCVDGVRAAMGSDVMPTLTSLKTAVAAFTSRPDGTGVTAVSLHAILSTYS